MRVLDFQYFYGLSNYLRKICNFVSLCFLLVGQNTTFVDDI